MSLKYSLQKCLQKLRRATATGPPASTHSRRTFGSLFKANGEAAKVVLELMRHANLSTTMNRYV